MSELNEALWSVLSERGCEASRLSYAAAARLVAQLAREPVYGLCIVTDAAAARLNHHESAPAKTPAKKRAPRRKADKS
jgi:hypothetical protein